MNINKYLLVSPAYPPPFIGGSSVWMYTLVENCNYGFDILTSILPKNEKEVISSRHTIYRKKRVHFSIQPKKLTLFISYLYQLLWIAVYVKKRNYKAVFANAEVVQNSLIILLGKLLKFKVIPMSYAEELTVPIYGKTLITKIKYFLLTFAYPKAYKHISCCHYAKNILSNEINISQNKIDVIPIAYSKEKLKLNIKKELNKKTQNILSVGRLIQRKGFGELIEVVKELKIEMPLLKLNIVGSGPLENILRKKVLKDNLQDYIVIHGKLSDDQLAELYLKSDLFVLAHRMLNNGETEGSPVTFAEAAIYKIPSIGGINSGASTIISHNKTGLIINMKIKSEIKNSIKKLLNNRVLLERMGEAAQKKIMNEHTPEKIGSDFRIILNTL